MSNASVDTNLTQQLDDLPSRQSSSRSYAQRMGSGEITGSEIPPRAASLPGGRASPRRHIASPQNSVHRPAGSRETGGSDSSVSSNTMHTIPVVAPYPETDTMPTGQHSGSEPPDQDRPPPPPPKQNDALTALQRGGDLERRASRRFSAYQIQKHLGTSVNGIGAIPPAQHSPVPNRGRDLRESMSAVRSRRSLLHSRSHSRVDGVPPEPSPSGLQSEVRRTFDALNTQIDDNRADIDSPTVKTPEDKLAEYPFPETRTNHTDTIGASLNGPMQEPFVHTNAAVQEAIPIESKPHPPVPARHGSRSSRVHTPPQSQLFLENSPQPGKELTLFLQYKSKIKKFVLPDGGDLTMARLQLAFIEKFAWNTHNNGVDLPEIYIQDPVSGVRHELEHLGDIKERSVLVLNVEALDEVKRHIDDGLGGLRRIVEGIRTSVDRQQGAIQLVSDRQQDTAKEIAGLAVAPARASIPSGPSLTGTPPRSLPAKAKSGPLNEVQSLRRDLAVVRQTYTSFASDIDASMATIRAKAAAVRTVTVKAAVPTMDLGSGRSYVNRGKKSLSEDSEKIVNRVDDLQDIVEDLRKDVVTRGVRPLPRQLEDVSKDISLATTDLKKLQEFLKREKPVWTKIWEKELQVVCDDRDLLTMQEDLAADLEDDLDKAAATFALVEEATKQQNLQNHRAGTPGPASSSSSSSTPRLPSRTVVLPLNPDDKDADPEKARTGVLGEVRALQPNHESRLEAIERAEKARQRELESRREDEFQRELGSFVEEGKLKKSGGVEEVERMRARRDEQFRRGQSTPNGSTTPAATNAAAAAAVAGTEAAAGGAGDGGLDVPRREGENRERESSPEPIFVEAAEEVSALSGE